MPKTYYDSELTGEQIESALEAIHDVVTPSNNGKVLYIDDGKIKAASASRWGHGAVLEPLNVTANGDYTPPTGTDGFDSVHVAVPGATLTAKSITQNGTYNASSDNADGYSSVTVNVSGGGGAVVQPLSVTQNGTYNPPSGVDGYAPVTVNVSGGGSDIPKDTTFLPNSTVANILCSSDISSLSTQPASVVGANIEQNILFDFGTGLFVDLSAANTDVTCYCVGKRVGTRGGEAFILGVPYALSTGNNPLFDISNNSGTIVYSTFSGNTTVSGKSGMDDHVYAIAVNGQTKKARFYIDGTYLGEKAFNNSGAYVAFAKGMKATNNYDGDFRLKYVGAVSEFETDENVIANMQTIMQKLGLE